KAAFDDVHLQVYGQSAPKEDAEIVTFRLQAEMVVPRLRLPALSRGDAAGATRACKGERAIYDIDAGRFVAARIYQREKLLADDRIAGPAVIDQLDSTTVILSGQQAVVDVTGTLVIEAGSD